MKQIKIRERKRERTICKIILHKYQRKMNVKNIRQSNFFSVRIRFLTELCFYGFWWEIRQKNAPNSKTVDIQNRC